MIIDGAGEHHYELAFHHGGELFELRAWQRARYAALGMGLVRYHAPGGLVAALARFDLNEDALYWLRSRQGYSVGYFAAVRRQIDGLNRKIKLATIPRTAAFSALTTQDYYRMHPYFD